MIIEGIVVLIAVLAVIIGASEKQKWSLSFLNFVVFALFG
jgi:hypothetical protein